MFETHVRPADPGRDERESALFRCFPSRRLERVWEQPSHCSAHVLVHPSTSAGQLCVCARVRTRVGARARVFVCVGVWECKSEGGPLCVG